MKAKTFRRSSIWAALFALLVCDLQTANAGDLFTAGRIAHAVLQVADTGTTVYAIQAQRGYEANPLMRRLTERTIPFVAVKVAIAAGVDCALRSYEKRHPKAARIATWVLVGGYAAVLANNVRVIRRSR